MDFLFRYWKKKKQLVQMIKNISNTCSLKTQFIIYIYQVGR